MKRFLCLVVLSTILVCLSLPALAETAPVRLNVFAENAVKQKAL